MGCLACGQETAQDSHGAAHDLAGLLCLAHLVEAVSAAPAAAQGSGVEPLSLRQRRCSGLRRTCPEPVTAHYLNGSHCRRHAPADRAAPEPFTPTSGIPIPAELAEAVAIVSAYGTVIREHRTYGEPLEGS